MGLLSRGPELFDRLSFADENALGIFDFGEGLRSRVVGSEPNGKPGSFGGEVETGGVFSLALRTCPFACPFPLGGVTTGDTSRLIERLSEPADKGDGPGMIEWGGISRLGSNIEVVGVIGGLWSSDMPVKIQRSFTREGFVKDKDVRSVKPCPSRALSRPRIWFSESIGKVSSWNPGRV